jgi:hypothetical protein
LALLRALWLSKQLFRRAGNNACEVGQLAQCSVPPASARTTASEAVGSSRIAATAISQIRLPITGRGIPTISTTNATERFLLPSNPRLQQGDASLEWRRVRLITITHSALPFCVATSGHKTAKVARPGRSGRTNNQAHAPSLDAESTGVLP